MKFDTFSTASQKLQLWMAFLYKTRSNHFLFEPMIHVRFGSTCDCHPLLWIYPSFKDLLRSGMQARQSFRCFTLPVIVIMSLFSCPPRLLRVYRFSFSSLKDCIVIPFPVLFPYTFFITTDTSLLHFPIYQQNSVQSCFITTLDQPAQLLNQSYPQWNTTNLIHWRRWERTPSHIS